MAKDQRGSYGGLNSTTSLLIYLLDVNDNPPRFLTSYRYTVSESLAPNSMVGVVGASDLDGTTSFTYSIVSGGNGQFYVDRVNGKPESTYILTVLVNILTKKRPIKCCQLRLVAYKRKWLTFPGSIYLVGRLDYETKSVYYLNVSVNDNGLIPCPLVAYTEVTVAVQDENDNVPEFTDRVKELRVGENQRAGTVVGTVNATDKDSASNGRVSFFLSGKFWLY